jgi:hypothetical protein
MALNAEESGHLAALRDLVTEAEGHHRAACDAADSGDKAALSSAHIRMGRCIRSMQVRFARMADDGMLKNTDMQVAGTEGGTSSPPRAGHPLLHGDIAGWAARAFGRKAK